jgi:CheY-like chemotaxis protein
VSNLLTNAAKYTPPGGEISLCCELTEPSLAISVQDTGIGLAPEAFSKVFDMFVQIEPSKDRADGGLGIGLALVKGLMALHGGGIVVHSAGRDKGSTFTVTLPRSVIVESANPDSSLSSGGSAREADPCRVLVADDNADGAEALAMYLQRSGHEVHVARNGIEALEIAARVKPHVAVLDIGMPGLSGYEVATRIRSEAWGTKMTLVALTGWGQDGDKREAQAAGFDHQTPRNSMRLWLRLLSRVGVEI